MLDWKGLARREHLILLTLLALVLSFNYKLIFTDQVPFFRDLGPYFYPMRYALAESFKAGELPLWDPRTGLGFPLLADFQSGVFYPPHLFFLVFPFFTAVKVGFLFHYLIAATGSYALCRRWDFPPFLALIGALLFTFSGVVVSLSNLLNHFQTAVWLPWGLFFWERFLSGRRWSDFLMLVVVLALQFLGGSPELYVMNSGLLLIDGLRVGRELGVVRPVRSVLFYAAANVLVIGVAMVQVMPTLELFLQSRGSRAILYGESVLWSLDPLSLINLFFIDKEVDPELLSGMHLFLLREIPFFISHYMGAIAMLGVSFWMLYSGAKERALFLGLLAVTLTLAMGSHTPVYPVLFRYVPLFGLFRFPEKFFFLSTMLLLWATMRGLYVLLERNAPASRGTVVVLGLVFAGVVGLYLFCRFETSYLIRLISQATSAPPSVTLRSSAGVIFYLERQVLLVAGLLLIFALWKKRKLKAWLFQAVMVGLVFVDLSTIHQPYQFLLAPSVAMNSPKIIEAPKRESGRFFYYPGPSNVHPSYYKLPRPVTFVEFTSLIFGQYFPNTGVFYGVDYMQELDALMRRPYRTFLGVASNLPAPALYRLLGALNVRYLTSLQPMPEGDMTLVRHLPEYPAWLYRLNRVVPRAYIVGEVVVERDAVQTLGKLASERFDPLTQVILERPLEFGAAEGLRAQAEIVSYGNREVRLRASLSRSGVLVLADSYYPGWRVYVDGKETEILRANLFFRAVPLSAGDHLVEFRYRPWSLTMGVWISLISFSAITLGTVVLTFHKTKDKYQRRP